ncbi:13116_t:CDS:2 [Racocetra fulgida]|uniref:13116_t:CDS:1 n=1 Tax=Racocetra fulgida TaxID=60492 RepID=A0A9N9CM75_9GLOM|nr:13116_t:CDS:2 [Racocetra fulgida]
MPSEHWLELVDCWMCHQEDYQQARMSDIIVRENIGLVGNTYFLIHPKDVKSDAVEIEERLAQVDFSKQAVFVELESDTNDAFIAADLFEAAKAHATYRFIIEGQNSNQTYALVRISC